MNLKIEVTIKLSGGKLETLNKFSDENWDEHEVSLEEERANFFDNDKFAVIAKIDGNMVGYLFVHERNLIFNRIPIKLAGIGGVVVHRKFRHKGIATAILTTTIKLLKKEKFDIALLSTDINKLGELYKRVGFVPLGKPYSFIDIKGLRKEENGGMIANINSKEIFDEILTSNNKLNVGISNF